MDQLLIGHAGEQGHHGDLGVGSVQLLTGAQHRGLGALEQEEHLGRNPFNQKNISCQTETTAATNISTPTHQIAMKFSINICTTTRCLKNQMSLSPHE